MHHHDGSPPPTNTDWLLPTSAPLRRLGPRPEEIHLVACPTLGLQVQVQCLCKVHKAWDAVVRLHILWAGEDQHREWEWVVYPPWQQGSLFYLPELIGEMGGSNLPNRILEPIAVHVRAWLNAKVNRVRSEVRVA